MIQIKKTIKAGNSSAVTLPRSWLNKEVRVELVKKTLDEILDDTISITRKYIDIKEIIGIYLTGSYARNEENENSDIDVIIITRDIDKELISEGIYNILIISTELLNQKLYQDLLPVGQMLIEAKPLLNELYLNEIKKKIKVTGNNIKWYLETTKDKLNLINKEIKKMENTNKKYVHDRIIYTLILRIKTLYIIKTLIKNEGYSKKIFIKMIKNISESDIPYQRYLSVKNYLEEKSVIKVEIAEILSQYLENLLREVRELMRN